MKISNLHKLTTVTLGLTLLACTPVSSTGVGSAGGAGGKADGVEYGLSGADGVYFAEDASSAIQTLILDRASGTYVMTSRTPDGALVQSQGAYADLYVEGDDQFVHVEGTTDGATGDLVKAVETYFHWVAVDGEPLVPGQLAEVHLWTRYAAERGTPAPGYFQARFVDGYGEDSDVGLPAAGLIPAMNGYDFALRSLDGQESLATFVMDGYADDLSVFYYKAQGSTDGRFGMTVVEHAQ